MNERIRELAEQAGIVFWEISGDVDWRQANRENLEKFAELIVRECVMVASNPHLNDEESYYGNEFAKAIKKRFGVEE